MDSKLHKKLSERQEKGTLRSLSSINGVIDFCSNDYLGWSKEEVEISGKMGATGSRLISGNNGVEVYESQIAEFFRAESALMFNSGYDANLGFFSSVPQKGDVVLYDEHVHASVRDGIRMSFANAYPFRHNDVSHLHQRLKQFEDRTVYVAIESLYSMGGDIAPLKEIAHLVHTFEAYLVVDEAHAGGLFGTEGKGLCEEVGIEPFARLITFGKAYGSHGACVLCSVELRNYLVNFARSFIYTTALPEFVFKHNAELIMKREGSDRRDRLNERVDMFRKLMKEVELISDVRSPIQIIPIRTIEKTTAIANKLLEAGIAVKPIYSPTVAEGEECLRICLHAFNSEDELNLLAGIILEM